MGYKFAGNRQRWPCLSRLVNKEWDNMDETELKHEVTEFLEHYGVKGMKWGQRREQLRAANAKVGF